MVVQDLELHRPDLSLIQSLLIRHMEHSVRVINVAFVRGRTREGDHRILETRHSIKAETKEADKEVFVQLGLLPSLNRCLHKLVYALTLMSVFNRETALELYFSFLNMCALWCMY